jgi:uncharacterized membrane protein YedE/YeeE
VFVRYLGIADIVCAAGVVGFWALVVAMAVQTTLRDRRDRARRQFEWTRSAFPNLYFDGKNYVPDRNAAKR